MKGMATSQGNSSSSTLFDFDELAAELRPRMREWKTSWDLIRSNWTAMAGVIMILAIIILALIAPLIAPSSGANPTIYSQGLRAPQTTVH